MLAFVAILNFGPPTCSAFSPPCAFPYTCVDLSALIYPLIDCHYNRFIHSFIHLISIYAAPPKCQLLFWILGIHSCEDGQGSCSHGVHSRHLLIPTHLVSLSLDLPLPRSYPWLLSSGFDIIPLPSRAPVFSALQHSQLTWIHSVELLESRNVPCPGWHIVGTQSVEGMKEGCI